MNTLIRFLLHGLVFDAADGKHVHINSHLLRHALASELAELKVSQNVIAEILHERDVRVTKYYSRPTTMQIMKATELVERKRTWADEQRRWAARNCMLAEERQMKQLMQDCEMALIEMDLIQKARTDGSQLVRIRLREGESVR